MSQTYRVRQSLPVRMARSIRHAPMLSSCEAFWDLLRPGYRKLLSTLGGKQGLPIEIEGIGTIFAPSSFLDGDVDELELPMLRRFVEAILPDCCLYDVGASLGLHSIVGGSQLGETAEIHAFEPEIVSCAKYWANTRLLRQRMNVQLSRCFISDVSTTSSPLDLSPLQLLLDSPELKLAPSHHLYLFNQPEAEQIPQIRLDDYVQAGARPPTVIKSDIEGAELLLLQGAVTVLREYRPVLFISLHPELISNFSYTPEDFYAFLDSHDYKWEILNTIGETHVYAYPTRCSI
jgi:FkbM family methyltransferase